MVSELVITWVILFCCVLMLGIAIGLWFRQKQDKDIEIARLQSQKEVQ